MKPVIPEHVASERLVIRCPSLEDSAEIYKATQESMNELIPWMPWAKRSLTPEDTEESVRQAIAKFVTREDLRYHFHHKETGKLLVCSGLHRIDWSLPKFEIGYWCRTSEQGKGYVTEGVRALTEMAFGRLGAARVEIRCDDLNMKSAAIPERLGFSLEGILKHDSRSPRGELRSTRIYALTDFTTLK
ncbi:MAG: GNAT family N-acetyltransferase [Trueperaceae bacterium]|nr:GNAT family N-acetyltransferase [Trueperaceae bacterium]